MIGQGLVRQLFEYRDGVLYWRENKRQPVKGKAAGYVSSFGYLLTGVDGKMYPNHRLIWLYHYGTLPQYIDHIDGNRTNNRIENLREATKAQNCQNAKKQSRNTSGVKGVSWHKHTNKWRATLTANGKHRYLGYFHSIEEASKVVQEARELIHGAYANHG